MSEQIQFGSKTIEFRLEYSARKTLGIAVTPEMEVLVKAPHGTPSDKIHAVVRKKAPWILRQLSFFLAFHPRTPERQYVGGETHLFLGRQYRLQIIEDEQVSVKMVAPYLEVRTPDRTRVREILEKWYKVKAWEKFRQLAAPLVERFKKYGVAPSEIVLREMPARWGSCTPKGKIILNPELIKAPRGCIEYVIIHELCHLVHRNHTLQFAKLQKREMRDWEKWKEKLEAMLV